MHQKINATEVYRTKTKTFQMPNFRNQLTKRYDEFNSFNLLLSRKDVPVGAGFQTYFPKQVRESLRNF
jgi:hypothetical protein